MSIEPYGGKVDKSDKGNFFIGLGLVGLAIAGSEFFNPSTTRPTGRWSFLFGSLFDAGGSTAIVLYWIAIGAVFIVVGFFLRNGK